jgi:hypothetical protein
VEGDRELSGACGANGAALGVQLEATGAQDREWSEGPVFAFGEELDAWLEQQAMRNSVIFTEGDNARSPSAF